MMAEPYRLLIVSPIPVFSGDNGYRTMDLWVADVLANFSQTPHISLLCGQVFEDAPNFADLPQGVTVLFADKNDAELGVILAAHDVISIGAGAPFWQMKMALRVAKIARKQGKCVILSVSSNRAHTVRLNAKNASLAKRFKSGLTAWGITQSILRLGAIADGVSVVGQGVRDSLALNHPNIYVETASWIKWHDVLSEADFVQKLGNKQAPHALIATRLEPMKGVNIGVEAIAQLKRLGVAMSLSILGKGTELPKLQALTRQLDIADLVTFDGERNYPDAFYAAIRPYHLGLITNLNVEQPRLIFDFIAQGIVPICPDTTPYRHLALPEAILYKVGDAQDLAKTCLKLQDKKVLTDLMRQLRPLAQEYTIERMHEKRAVWINSLLKARQ